MLGRNHQPYTSYHNVPTLFEPKSHETFWCFSESRTQKVSNHRIPLIHYEEKNLRSTYLYVWYKGNYRMTVKSFQYVTEIKPLCILHCWSWSPIPITTKTADIPTISFKSDLIPIRSYFPVTNRIFIETTTCIQSEMSCNCLLTKITVRNGLDHFRLKELNNQKKNVSVCFKQCILAECGKIIVYCLVLASSWTCILDKPILSPEISWQHLSHLQSFPT